MIDIKTTLHDKFSIEFKEGFVVDGHQKDNNFAINTWLFIPHSLDINPATYGKEQFYRDVKSNVRMITPVFGLRDIAGGEAVSLKNLKTALDTLARDPSPENAAGYEYHIKMFAAIVKSSLRNESAHIANLSDSGELPALCDSYAAGVSEIVGSYRLLKHAIDVPAVSKELRSYYLFGDEFISHVINHYTFGVLRKLDSAINDMQADGPNEEPTGGQVRNIRNNEQTSDRLKKCRERVAGLIMRENDHKSRMGYVMLSPDEPLRNRDLVFRHGILKKYVESDLYIELDKKQDGRTVKQVYYGLAAGIAMIFATVVAFTFQRSYGALSVPLFAAMVISYMLKDRIKELMRYYFAHRLGRRYFDNKAMIVIKEQQVGWIKEGVDFITERKVPSEVMELRNRSSLREAENRIFDEKIILYRKLVYIDGEKLSANNEYNISGINDILRLHINSLTLKMDDPIATLSAIRDDGSVENIETEKIYYLNIVLQFQYTDHSELSASNGEPEHVEHTEYRHFNVVMTRNGILDIE